MFDKLVHAIVFTCLINMISFDLAFAQPIGCATTLTQDQYEAKRNENHGRSGFHSRQLDLSSSTIPVIAITVHIVRTTNGDGGVSLDYLEEELSNVNDAYLSAGLQFYIKEVNYIDNNDLYNFSFTEEGELADSRDVANTINIYFVQEVSFGFFGGTACGYAYLPGTGPDRIIISNNCADNGSTVIHEIGHFFNLIHTHGTSNSPGNTNELVNGSNCDTSGDLVCDTPADPVLSESIVNPLCFYTGNARDGNNQLFTPDPTNIMSYSRVSCRDSFSPGQYERMRDSYEMDRSYLLLKPTIADFTASVDKICEGEEISFTDISKNAVSYNWIFQGGTPSISTSSSPQVVYNTEGVFPVSLEVTSGEGEKDLRVYENFIRVRRSETGAPSFENSFENDTDLSDDSYDSDGVRFFELEAEYTSRGSRSVAINLFGDPDVGSLDRLFLNQTLTGENEYLLQFESAYATRFGFEDELRIGIESWCDEQRTYLEVLSGGELSQELSLENEFFPNSGDWRRNGLFFTNPFPEEVIRVFFETKSEGGNNLYIDNVRVRPIKSIDQDSIILVEVYDALNGQLPWDMNDPIQNWTGVVLSQEDRVTELDFTNFGISGVMPEALLDLDQLRVLNLQGNNIDPSEVILELSQLERLSLVSNGLTDLPSNWSVMTSLKHLDLRNNQLTQLPSSLFSLAGLEHLNVRNNKLVFNYDVTVELSPTLLSLDLSANGLEINPQLLLQNPETRINLSQNELGLLAILAELVPSRIYSPQALVGDVLYMTPSDNLELTCPIPLASGHQVQWLINNILATETSASLELPDLSPAYYQCEVMDPVSDDISLLSKPFLVNTPRSICEENLGGIYQVSTNYIDENDVNWDFVTQIDLTAVDNQLYDISDLSFGVETQRYSESELMKPIQFDCGQFFTPVEESHSYQILSTAVDIELNELNLTWINARGGQGTSVLTNLTPGLSNFNDILSFQFTSQFAPEDIDFFNKTISLRVGCSQFSSVPSFTLSDGASAYVDGELQESSVSTQDFTSPVTYTIIAEDGATNADWVITLIEEPSVVTATFTIENQSFCEPANGAIRIGDILVDDLSQISAVEDFDIKWSTDPDFNNVIGTELNMEGLTAGEYSLSIAQVFSGCGIRFDNIIIDDVTPIADLSINETSPNRSCGGSLTGSLSTSIDGLSSDLTITWEKQTDDQWVGLDDLDDLLSLDHLGEGTYRQTILDNVTGCSYDQVASVSSRPSILAVNATAAPNTDCASPNGSITINQLIQDDIPIGLPALGYSVAWYTDFNEQNQIGTAYSIQDLEAGTYYLRVTDDDLLCQSVLYSFFIASNTLEGTIAVESFESNTLCSTVGANGSLSVSLDGVTEGYSFDWFSGTKISGSPIGNAAAISEISGGTYTVKVTALAGDAVGCFSTLSTSIANDQEVLELEIAATPVTVCGSPNGTAEVVEFSVDGSSQSIRGTYEIEWSDNRSFNTIISDRTSVDDLAPDTYYARVINTVTGCSTGTVSVSVGLDLPEITPDFVITENTHCSEPFSGAIAITNLDPIADYSLAWYSEPPGDNAVPISNAATLTQLSAGTYYTVIEHVASGCSQQYQNGIDDNIVIPSVTVEIQPQGNCDNPNAMIQITSVIEDFTDSPIDNYAVEWSDDDSFHSVMGTEANLTDLTAGDYYLRLMNRTTGCSSVDLKYSVDDDTVNPTLSLINSIAEKSALGELGSLLVEIDYAGTYTLEWFDATDGGLAIGSELLLSSLKAGTYTAVVTTSNDCNVSSTFEVAVDNRVPQTIEFDLPNEVFVDAGPIELVAIATSDEEVNFTVESGPGQIVQDELKLLGDGQIELLAQVDANEEYFSSQRSYGIIIKPLLGISGVVLGNTSSGFARLYNQSWELVKDVTFNGATFLIDDLRPDSYYLEVTPAGIANDLDFVTYYPGEYSWWKAGLIELNEDEVIDIEWVTNPNNEVGHTIEGNVGATSGNTVFTLGELKVVNSPLRSTDVYLIENTTDILAAISATTFDGRVVFESIPTGEYYFFLNEVGNELDFSTLTLSIDTSIDGGLFTLEIGDTDQIDVVVVSGIEDWASGEVSVFPNPVSERLNIELEGSLSYEVGLSLFNLAGAEISRDIIAPGTKIFQLSTLGLPSGTYLLRFSDHKGTTTKKIIKR